MFWARLVDVHDINDQGQANLEPVYRDFAISETIQSDGAKYSIETNPITLKTRLIIRRQKGAPDTGSGTFISLLRLAAEGLPPVVPKHDDGSTGDQYSFVARNASLVLRFDDVLEDGFEARRDLADAVQVKVGYPPATHFGARHVFDPNYGALVNGEFHSTRVLIDLTVSASETSTMITPEPINAVGLPASDTSTTDPNVVIRIPTRTDFGLGQFELLRGLSGAPLAALENGPVDMSKGTQDVVRAMRAGNPTDLNNGFLLDLSAPKLLGGWGLRTGNAIALSDQTVPSGDAGFDYLLDITFTSICRGAPSRGDVISIGEVFLEVSEDSAAPDSDGLVQGLKVRNLADQPLDASAVLFGNATFLSTFQASDPVPPGCWVTISPPPAEPPALGVSIQAQVLVRFSEPMDPTSLSPFDSFVMIRGDSNSQVSSTNIIVATVGASTDLKEFTFRPTLNLPHDTNTAETYHVRIDGPTDLAGNSLATALPPINFEMLASDPSSPTGGVVFRFDATDEIFPAGLPDLRGQFFYDFDRGVIRPRPAALSSFVVDRVNPVPSIMIPLPRGVQTPLTPLGSKLQGVWRYCDLGWQVLDETKYNLDVYGLAWAPVGGSVINDNYERFEIALAHSRKLPDEAIDGNLLPKFVNSGLGSNFASNILNDPLARQKVVHERSRGYRINGADLFLASSGTIMLPYPLNRGGLDPVTYTWRDTAVLAKAGPGGAGIPMDIEVGAPLQLEVATGYVADRDLVPSIGLPLLIEYRCFPSNSGLGLNSLDLSIAINSSATPSFRAYSSGGINVSGVAVTRDPDTEEDARGGFNPSSNPPGRPTSRSDENGFYIGQLDVVPRLSRAHSVWINTARDDPDYSELVVLPLKGNQPKDTDVIIEYRGADGFILGDLDTALGEPVDESTYPFDAQRLNAYGEIFALFPELTGGQNPQEYRSHRLLGSPEFPGQVRFLNGVDTWSSDIDSVDGARYLQLRITFASNIETSLSPELSSVGIAFSGL